MSYAHIVLNYARARTCSGVVSWNPLQFREPQASVSSELQPGFVTATHTHSVCDVVLSGNAADVIGALGRVYVSSRFRLKTLKFHFDIKHLSKVRHTDAYFSVRSALVYLLLTSLLFSVRFTFLFLCVTFFVTLALIAAPLQFLYVSNIFTLLKLSSEKLFSV